MSNQLNFNTQDNKKILNMAHNAFVFIQTTINEMLMCLRLHVPGTGCTLLWPSFSHPFNRKPVNPRGRWGANTEFAPYNIQNTVDRLII